VQDSNLRRPRCKRGALTTELTARRANSRASQPDCERGLHRSRLVQGNPEDPSRGPPTSLADAEQGSGEHRSEQAQMPVSEERSRQRSYAPSGKVGWCPGRDLNPDGSLHTPLKRTRIPIPPPGHEGYVRRMSPFARSMVPRRGFEPLQPCGHWLLKPARLPIPPPRRAQRRAIRRWRGASLAHPNIDPRDRQSASPHGPGHGLRRRKRSPRSTLGA
jgi:hypothetical protein